MFANCSSLKTIVLPSTLKTIDVCTFDYCSSLTSVTLPENLETIGEYAFRDCSGIKKIKIPASVSKIDWQAFDDCNSLEKAFIRNPECSISSSAFTSVSDVNVVTVICYKDSSAQKYAKIYEKNIILFSDVKYDGKIDLYDLIKICQNIAGVIDIKGDEFEIADVRENGAIDLYDAIAVARMLVSQ